LNRAASAAGRKLALPTVARARAADRERGLRGKSLLSMELLEILKELPLILPPLWICQVNG
jgi:hypothetical protein